MAVKKEVSPREARAMRSLRRDIRRIIKQWCEAGEGPEIRSVDHVSIGLGRSMASFYRWRRGAAMPRIIDLAVMEAYKPGIIDQVAQAVKRSANAAGRRRAATGTS